MRTETMYHLTEEQLCQALVCPEFGAVPSGADFLSQEDLIQEHLIQEHLSQCSQCTNELGSLRTALAGFRDASKGLAAAHFSPRLEVRGHGLLHGMRASMLAWPLSLAAAGVLCAASVFVLHRPAVQSRSEVTAAARQTVSPESDESLLDGINNDLSAPVPPSLEPLAVSAAEGSGRSN